MCRGRKCGQPTGSAGSPSDSDRLAHPPRNSATGTVLPKTPKNARVRAGSPAAPSAWTISGGGGGYGANQRPSCPVPSSRQPPVREVVRRPFLAARRASGTRAPVAMSPCRPAAGVVALDAVSPIRSTTTSSWRRPSQGRRATGARRPRGRRQLRRLRYSQVGEHEVELADVGDLPTDGPGELVPVRAGLLAGPRQRVSAVIGRADRCEAVSPIDHHADAAHPAKLFDVRQDARPEGVHGRVRPGRVPRTRTTRVQAPSCVPWVRRMTTTSQSLTSASPRPPSFTACALTWRTPAALARSASSVAHELVTIQRPEPRSTSMDRPTNPSIVWTVDMTSSRTKAMISSALEASALTVVDLAYTPASSGVAMLPTSPPQPSSASSGKTRPCCSSAPAGTRSTGSPEGRRS